VGRIDGDRIMAAAAELDLRETDALVLSACVQMPSLDLVQTAEQRFGVPVVTASTAGAFTLLQELGLAPALPGAGALLRT
jgi:maleate isomerase